LAHIIDKLEHKLNVLEYYDQPPPIELNYQSKSGRKVRTAHTPDFFVLELNWAGWEEFKPINELIKKAQQQPNRYILDETGSWFCPPGEEYAQKYGLNYRIRTDIEQNTIRLRNYQWLEPYFQSIDSLKDNSLHQTILSLVKAKPGLSYSELLLAVPRINADEINRLIAIEKLFINFNTAPLAEPNQVRIFPTREQAEIYEQKALSGLSKQEVNQDTSEVQKLLLKARPIDLETANARYEAIKPYLEKNSPPITKANRSLRRWRKQYYEAQKLYGENHGYVGLLPKHLEKGHHQKLEPALLDFMADFIKKHYFTTKNRRVSGVYREFHQACSQHQPPFKPPSEKTFRSQIKRQKNYQLTLARQGSKIAKQNKPFHSTDGIPKNGELPWENAHIDHTCLDINLVSSLISLATCNVSSAISAEQISLGRCWATFMVDGYSKRILAVYLSFEPPSYRSCLMVMRICVKRFQRLPQTIITDNGKEFHSVYFKQLLAYCNCHHKYRPSGEPRYGNPVERVFGTTNTLWLHELQGNTQILKNNRQVTKSVNPIHQAIWTIGELYQSLETWAYSIYDNRLNSSLGQSPFQAYETGIQLGGKREIRRLEYDQTFLILTLPSPQSGDTRIVQPGRGVKINHIYYWCHAFRDPEVEKTAVEVKIDPFNVSVAYCYVKGRWHECTSNHYSYLQGRTEKELQVISADLRQRKRHQGCQTVLSNRELVEHLQGAYQVEEKLLKQRLQALENQTVLDLIEGKQLSSNSLQVTHQDELKNDSFVLPHKTNDDETLESYGEF
jgi:transposase InsO family protein